MKRAANSFFIIAISITMSACGPGQVFGPTPTPTPTSTHPDHNTLPDTHTQPNLYADSNSHADPVEWKKLLQTKSKKSAAFLP